jgi:hypothetical protein
MGVPSGAPMRFTILNTSMAIGAVAAAVLCGSDIVAAGPMPSQVGGLIESAKSGDGIVQEVR